MDGGGIAHQGWLTKSPAEKKIWRTTWTRRWFVLKQSGQIPGQYVLEYYTDETCRKLKGRVDLDQCEQVDAGLSYTARSKQHPFMFDLKTTKRTYYLAAQSEVEMQKWVNCICSVCGLKVHSEESVDYRYSPQPSQECVVSSSGVVATPGNNNNNSSTNLSGGGVIKSEPKSLRTNNGEAGRPTTATKKKYEPSGPYVPIWETNTGKPIFSSRAPLKESTSRENISNVSVQMNNVGVVDDAYDIPRPLNLPLHEHKKVNGNILTKVPPPSKQSIHEVLKPPKVNWKTHPNPETVSSITGDSRGSIRSYQGYQPEEPTSETRRASTPNGNYYNTDSIIQNESMQHQPPPRPPKPENLRKTRNNSESCISTQTSSDISSSSYETFIPVDDKQSRDKYSPTTKVPLPSNHMKSTPSGLTPDEMYDIPKPADHTPLSCDILNTNVPVMPNTLKREGMHSYSNAPPGRIASKESVFIYDTKPCLPTTSDDQIANQDSESLDRSPMTPNSALYSNIPSGMTPPAVNRELKPRRKGSDSDATASPTTPNSVFPLCAPPAIGEAYNKKCFRKPSPNRVLNGTPPRIPSRGRQVIHSREPSASEEEATRSRRNSNDDQVRQTVPPPRKPVSDHGEIQYLDLSLDSDTSTPSTRLGSGSDNHKSLSSLPREGDGNPTIGPSGSTVYKTVDFLKTKAFNKLIREESQRSSQ